MYYLQLRRFSPDQIEHLLTLTRQLDLAPGPSGSRMADYAKTYDVFRSTPIVNGCQRCTVIALYPSSQIVAHRDPPVNGTRYHVPLQVNSGCWVFHGETWQQLEVGKLYTMDPAITHGAVNWGTEIRLHLIVDV